MGSKRVFFDNQRGVRLAGIVDIPEGDARAFSIFSHCFTCSKDLKAIVRISRWLAKNGIAVLRFDFTGLGHSKGSFPDSNFTSNLEDVDAAIRFLEAEFRPPELLIGHSLGGAAMMVKASQVDSALGLATIASPSSTEHLAGYLSASDPNIDQLGEGSVKIGGRDWNLKKQLLDDLRATDLPTAIQKIQIPHLIMHPPEDDTLPFWHAEKLFELTAGAKSMVTLDGADHLLVDQPYDVVFVADLISLWANRFLESKTSL